MLDLMFKLKDFFIDTTFGQLIGAVLVYFFFGGIYCLVKSLQPQWDREDLGGTKFNDQQSR